MMYSQNKYIKKSGIWVKFQKYEKIFEKVITFFFLKFNYNTSTYRSEILSKLQAE